MTRANEDGWDEMCRAVVRGVVVSWNQAGEEALTQADALLEDLSRRGRYPRDVVPKHREADQVILARALLRARQRGSEDRPASLYPWAVPDGC